MHRNHEDSLVVEKIKEGDLNAVVDLIRLHQDWIYNIAFRMTVNIQEAEDITQEILIKILTKIGSFNEKSRLKTWIYRMTVNHVIDMKRKKKEQLIPSFVNHEAMLKTIEDREYNFSGISSSEGSILLNETRTGCIMGMLLCLNRKDRLVFIIGGIMGIDSNTGSEIMSISAINFRKILSRARKRLYNYMNEKCGLFNESNTCRCSKKLSGSINRGLVNPKSLKFADSDLSEMRKIAELNISEFPTEELLSWKVDNFFAQQKPAEHPDFSIYVTDFLNKKQIKRITEY
ncbi:MAG: RNA polymerase sigma factor [Spirochaetes bacterium]|nr:RNA polymerase sigma factor [Spirochaetota bacterium]